MGDHHSVDVVTGDGVRLWWSIEGAGPPVILVPGRGDTTDIYPRRFTDQIIDAGFQIIRYDPRDTGQSDDGGDMTGDVLAVLDAAGVSAAHVVGLSMAGFIITDLVDRAPERVLSIAFVSSASPDPNAGIGEDFFEMIRADPVTTMIGAMAPTTAADRAWVEAEVAITEARSPVRPDAGRLHQEAVYRSTWPTLDQLRAVRVPVLVIHGSADRKLPVAHGHAFAREIRDSELVVMDGMGHLPRPAEWDTIASIVADHLRKPTD